MLKKNITRQVPGGFSLIEVIVAVSLVTIILAGLWGGVSFSRKTTSSSMFQSDAFASTSTGFRKLDIFLADFSIVNFPVADTSSAYAVVEDYIGNRWAIYLSENRKSIIAKSVDNESSQVLFTTAQTRLIFTSIDFHSMAGKELKLTVKLDNINGSEIKALTTFAASYEVGL